MFTITKDRRKIMEVSLALLRCVCFSSFHFINDRLRSEASRVESMYFPICFSQQARVCFDVRIWVCFGSERQPGYAHRTRYSNSCDFVEPHIMFIIVLSSQTE